MPREIKVGLLVVTAFVVLGVGVFLVSERKNLFALKNRYSIQFETVGGLAPGSPAQLDGVNVGSVQKIVLPEEVEQKMLTVWITADRRYAARIRDDSLARIKTLGLLGDKYIEISSGSSAAEVIPDGGAIPAAPATDVDRLIATGGDAVDNFVAISYSLREILARMESGEGILGELTTDSEAGKRAKEAMLTVLESMREISRQVESGPGTLGRLIRDGTLAAKLEATVDRLDGLLTTLHEGDGALPLLLRDPDTGERALRLVDGLGQLSEDLAALVKEMRSGEGLLGTLISDAEYGDQFTLELQQLIHNLNLVSQRLAQADGTLGLLIADPQVYDAVNDILVGVNESKLLRWLIRNRQKKGIKERYEAEQEQLERETTPTQDIPATEGSG